MHRRQSPLCLAEQDPKLLSADYYNITSFMLYYFYFTLALTSPLLNQVHGRIHMLTLAQPYFESDDLRGD